MPCKFDVDKVRRKEGGAGRFFVFVSFLGWKSCTRHRPKTPTPTKPTKVGHRFKTAQAPENPPPKSATMVDTFVVDGSIGTILTQDVCVLGQAGWVWRSCGAKFSKLSRSSGMRFTEGRTFKREKGCQH